MCLRAIGKVAGSRERLARDSRSAHKRDEQESKLEKTKKLEWDPERRRQGERGQQWREARAWPSSGLPSATEKLGGAYAFGDPIPLLCPPGQSRGLSFGRSAGEWGWGQLNSPTPLAALTDSLVICLCVYLQDWFLLQ